MPGIIGFAGRQDDEAANRGLLERMAQALEPEARFRVELFQEGTTGLGRVTLGIVNGSPQPVWNHSQTRCLMMEGELYDTQGTKRTLEGQGYRFQSESDAELLLYLYEEYGEDFVMHVNGSFIAAIWDRSAQKLTLANDRLGLHPLYYNERQHGLLFGSGVRALLADNTLPRCVDKIGIAEFLTFDHLLHQRTLLEDVTLMPQASILTYEHHNLQVRNYWRPQHPLEYELLSEQEWMELLLHRLRQAVRRQAPNGTNTGMLLSGGLDSRALLGLMREGTRAEPFYTFTWGIPGCDDARYAREVAAKLETKHYFFELRPDWLLQYAEECVRRTDGMGNVVNLHARATLDQNSQYAQILYKGFLGDAMMGFAQRPQHWADYDSETATQAHLQVHQLQGVIAFPPEQHKDLYTNAFSDEIGHAVLENYRRGMLAANCPSLADQRIYFDYCQRIPRHTLNGVEVVRSRAVVRLPFADYDLIDLMLNVPTGWRYERRLMRNTFIYAFPKLARIPVPDTGLPMLDCARDIIIRAQRWMRWHASKAGFKRMDYLGRRPYKDYANWFRSVLRPWVEETLLSPQALERGYLRPEFVRRIVQEHMAGNDHSVRLGVLLSIELWHRQFID